MAHGKVLKDAQTRYDRERLYAPTEAFDLVKSLSNRKFDETVEVAMRLGVDPRKADQMIRGTVSLPHGTGKSVRVAVFAAGDQAREAEAAGADVVGADDLVARIEKGASNPRTDTAGQVTADQVRQIAETKMPDLNAIDLDGAILQVAGTARSMGIAIEG